MPYCTPLDLLEKCEALELAQVSVAHAPVACRADVLAAIIKSVSPPADASPADIALAQQGADTIAAECLRASGRIDMSLRVRYTLPIPSPQPPELKAIAIDIARYYLHDVQAPKEIRTRYEDAIALLDAIAGGTADITLPPDGTASSGGFPAYRPGWPQVFTYGRLRDF